MFEHSILALRSALDQTNIEISHISGTLAVLEASLRDGTVRPDGRVRGARRTAPSVGSRVDSPDAGQTIEEMHASLEADLTRYSVVLADLQLGIDTLRAADSQNITTAQAAGDA